MGAGLGTRFRQRGELLPGEGDVQGRVEGGELVVRHAGRGLERQPVQGLLQPGEVGLQLGCHVRQHGAVHAAVAGLHLGGCGLPVGLGGHGIVHVLGGHDVHA